MGGRSRNEEARREIDEIETNEKQNTLDCSFADTHRVRTQEREGEEREGETEMEMEFQGI
ncbi:hypothetical protein TIFTF001_018463 [Ficus carica]|uniref:Uncharacterized protein n=1 Tax=Ficus carica TaxID=3494 RepID=A0AA88D9A3_FICCA|nr:hypothetical protein TIFTF001_018463 [Ficus carica]